MTDARADSDEHGPIGYEPDGPRTRGTEPADYVGVKDHGPAGEGTRAPRRALPSNVWGGGAVAVTSEHAMSCGYCGASWPNSVCMAANTHPGMDIGIVRGTPLFAAEGGTVEFAGWGDYYRPHHVDIRTPAGELHIYGHMWSVDSSVVLHGHVRAGQYLGTSGEQTHAGTMTPDETGAHLHFERRNRDGCALSPEETLVGGVSGGGGGTNGGTPLRCPPDGPPDPRGEEITVNNVVFHPAKQRVESAIDGLRRRKWASVQACETGDPLPQGAQVLVFFWVKGENVDGDERWWVADDGSRIWVGGTVQKPS
jgi:hypothetical protein